MNGLYDEIRIAMHAVWHRRWFALAVAWWAYADASGYTKRRVIEKENLRKQMRIDRQRSALGMLSSRSAQKRRK